MTDTVPATAVTGPTTDPSLDDLLLHDGIARLRRAQQVLTQARRAATVAKDELARSLFDATATFRAQGLSPPPDVLDHLYWDVRDLRVVDLARAFGLTTTELLRHVRPRTEAVPCVACGQPAQAERRTRSDLRHVRCRACRQAEEEHRERVRRQRDLEAGRWDEPAWDEARDPASVGVPPWADVPPMQHDRICDVCHGAAGGPLMVSGDATRAVADEAVR